MAINPESQYPGKIAPSSADYPYGEARNITVPGDGKGTPWESALVNDIFGFQQAALTRALRVPTGSPETAQESQYLESILQLCTLKLPTFAGLLAADLSEQSWVETISYSTVPPLMPSGGACWFKTGGTGSASTSNLGAGLAYDAAGNEWKIANPRLYASMFGSKGDATYTLNGSGIPDNWSGTDNQAAWQTGLNCAHALKRYVLHVEAGAYLFGGTVQVPPYCGLRGDDANACTIIPANTGFTASETPIIKFNDTAGDIDGVSFGGFTFQMNGLNATKAIGLQFYKCNVLTRCGEVLWTQLGIDAVGLDVYRGSSVFFDKLRFNGGTNSAGTVFVGTNWRIRECPGIFANSVNVEHGNLGIQYENQVDADGLPVYMPTLSINNLYCEHHATEVMTILADNSHLYTQPMIHLGHVEARSSLVSAGSIIKVLPYSGANHNVCLNIGALQLSGNFLHAVETPTHTWDVHLCNFFYKAGNQVSVTRDGLEDAFIDNPRFNAITMGSGEPSNTLTKIEFQTSAGVLGTVQVDNTNGRIKIFGTNGVRIADSGALGFFGSSGGTKPTVTGSRGGNAALASLLAALAGLGLVTDSSSA